MKWSSHDEPQVTWPLTSSASVTSHTSSSKISESFTLFTFLHGGTFFFVLLQLLQKEIFIFRDKLYKSPITIYKTDWSWRSWLSSARVKETSDFYISSSSRPGKWDCWAKSTSSSIRHQTTVKIQTSLSFNFCHHHHHTVHKQTVSFNVLFMCVWSLIHTSLVLINERLHLHWLFLSKLMWAGFCFLVPCVSSLSLITVLYSW